MTTKRITEEKVDIAKSCNDDKEIIRKVVDINNDKNTACDDDKGLTGKG